MIGVLIKMGNLDTETPTEGRRGEDTQGAGGRVTEWRLQAQVC